MSSLEQKFEELTKKEGHVEEADIAAIFDQAKPVEPEYLIGQWEGGSFDTGHPTHELLKTHNWAGKNFHTVDDVEPIVLYDSAGARVWNKDYGKAQLRETKFRGVVSAAMIYDNFPIIDSFRYISHNVVIGGMDNKLIPKEAGTYYFYLRKIVG
ncbi:hypothetical protein Neosp_007616 [[Neocosmospora] mangrovei]